MCGHTTDRWGRERGKAQSVKRRLHVLECLSLDPQNPQKQAGVVGHVYNPRVGSGRGGDDRQCLELTAQPVSPQQTLKRDPASKAIVERG